MKRLAGFATALLAATPALASPCSEAIAALQGRVRNEATASISASTSGQAEAGARAQEGKTTGLGKTGPGETGQGNTDEAAPGIASPETSAQAGRGADAAMQAKVALDEARTADSKGDAGACEAAVGRARTRLDAAP